MHCSKIDRYRKVGPGFGDCQHLSVWVREDSKSPTSHTFGTHQIRAFHERVSKFAIVVPSVIDVANQCCFSNYDIMKQTGHRSLTMIRSYCESAGISKKNSSGLAI
jgi:hypothetical protein